MIESKLASGIRLVTGRGVELLEWPKPCQRKKDGQKCGRAARIVPPDKVLTCIFCWRERER